MADLPPPTSRLPPIQKIVSYSTGELIIALQYLRLIYIPEVRGSRRRRLPSTSVTPMVSLHQITEPQLTTAGIEDIRSETFERSYVIKWLMALISHVESWDREVDLTRTKTDSRVSPTDRESLIQDAASLLAVCSGTAAAGMITRDFSFVHDGKTGETFKVLLTDVPLDNHDYGSVGAQTWGSACILAEMIVEQPAQFGLGDNVKKGIRVLELGAGTGLVSLALGKFIQTTGAFSGRNVTIIATDYFPSVLQNLKTNVFSNFSSSTTSSDVHSTFDISVHPLNWSSFQEEVSPFEEQFDLVLGADIIYEVQHALWIKLGLEKLLRKPDSRVLDGESSPMFHLVIPLRSTHVSESRTIEAMFPRCELIDHHSTSMLELCIIAKESIVCDSESGLEFDKVEYAYYKIGWY